MKFSRTVAILFVVLMLTVTACSTSKDPASKGSKAATSGDKTASATAEPPPEADIAWPKGEPGVDGFTPMSGAVGSVKLSACA